MLTVGSYFVKRAWLTNVPFSLCLEDLIIKMRQLSWEELSFNNLIQIHMRNKAKLIDASQFYGTS